jgi:hypothetical protein
VFGGDTQGTASSPYLNDLWILSGANGTGISAWQQGIAQGAAGSPSPRENSTAVYDQSSNRMIMFGGDADGGGFNDLWILLNADGTSGTPTWVQQFPTNPPPGRSVHTAVYDPATNRMIIYGGQTAASFGTFLGDAWVLTNANGTEASPPAWIRLSPNGSIPTARSHHVAAYDSTLNKMVIYGGEGLVDTWVLSNANGLGGSPQWTLLAPTGQPPPQFGDTHSMYDPQTQRLIIFGGSTPAGPSTNATVVLINATGSGSSVWQTLTPAGTLAFPRAGWAGGYDQTHNVLIVFAGEDVIGPGNAPVLNDTWVLTNANGIVGPQLTVNQASPNHGGNAGTATVALTGTGFQSGAQVKLTGSGADILGTNTQVLDVGYLTTTFDLTGATPGIRDVVITNPDGTSATLTGGFTVEQGGAPQISVSIVGRDKIRIGTNQTFYVTLSNSGNIDAGIVPLSIQVPNYVNLTPEFTITSSAPDPTSSGDSPEVPVSTATITLPLLVPVVPAGSSTSVAIELAVSSAVAPFNLQSWVTPPWIGEISASAASGNPEAIHCVADIVGSVLGLSNSEIASTVYDEVEEWAVNATEPKIPAYQIIGKARSFLDFMSELFTDFGFGNLGITNLYADTSSVLKAFQTVIECVDVAQRNSQTNITISPVTSLDPNDKLGPQGVGVQAYVSGNKPLPYSVYFDNQPTAAAPAQAVTVTDTLDPNLNPSTLTLGPITFPNQVVSPPSIPLFVSPFTTTVDLRPTTNLLVQVTASFNTSTATLTEAFQSLDPTTNKPPTDPTVGFLPPGAEGSVFFTVLPKTTVTTGTVIQNTATVVFDANAPINTPTWTNTIDNTPPASHVSALPAQSGSIFSVQWSGTDTGSGLGNFTVYVSDNGGSFTPWLTQTTATSRSYNGQVGHSYRFYSIAQDLVGNMEPAKTSAEATTQVTQASPVPSGEMLVTASGLAYSRVTQTFNGTVTIQNIGSSAIYGPFEVVFTAVTGGVTLATATGTYNGSAYLSVPGVTSLAPGQSSTVNVQFKNPSNAKISFTPVIYSGGLN